MNRHQLVAVQTDFGIPREEVQSPEDSLFQFEDYPMASNRS